MLFAMAYRAVLVISRDPDYLDEVAEALSEVDAFGVLVEDREGAEQALGDGFLPELVLMDPLLAGAPGVDELLLLLRATPPLQAVPVLALSTPAPPGTPERRSRRRIDRDALIASLQKFEDGGPSAFP